MTLYSASINFGNYNSQLQDVYQIHKNAWLQVSSNNTIAHYGAKLSSHTTSDAIVTEILKKVGPFYLLLLCGLWSQINNTVKSQSPFLSRIKTGLNDINNGINLEFGDTSSKVLLKYFFDMYSIDHLEEYVNQERWPHLPSFFVDVHNLCVAEGGFSDLKTPNISFTADPVLRLVAGMQNGNIHDYSATDFTEIRKNILNRNSNPSNCKRAWDVILAKYVEKGWGKGLNEFMACGILLLLDRDLSPPLDLILSFIEYNHHIQWSNLKLTMIGHKKNRYENLHAMEQFVLLTTRLNLIRQPIMTKKEWWPNLISSLWAHHVNNFFMPTHFIFWGILKARQTDGNAPRGFWGATCRLATEIATKRMPAPEITLEMRREGFDLTWFKNEFTWHIAAATCNNTEKYCPADDPQENAARDVRKYIKMKHVIQLVEYIFSQTPILDNEAWNYAYRLFEVADGFNQMDTHNTV
ncbi:MAG: hypothetical protein LLF94_11820 [Chlamydiales bacterium]|nr:hypothetical protein [Chlamydiales bacterium]